MPYCRPEKILPSAENLGEVLRGDRIENSPYEASFDSHMHVQNGICVCIQQSACCRVLTMRIERNSLGGKLIVALLQIFIRVDEQCKTLCKIDALSANQAKAFKGKIEDDYRVLM